MPRQRRGAFPDLSCWSQHLSTVHLNCGHFAAGAPVGSADVATLSNPGGGEISQRLGAEFEVEANKADRSVLALVHEVAQHKLVQLVD